MWGISGVACQGACFKRRYGSMILVHGGGQPRSLETGTMGRTSAVSLPCSRLLWLSLHGPRRVLEHHPIPIEILERLPLGFPIGIIRGDTLKPRCKHPGTTGFPFVLVGQVEDQQMILRGSCADLVSPWGRELQMIGMV